MELKIITAIQSGCTKVLNDIMLLITQMGDVVFFVAIFCILYWCYNKRYALMFSFYYLTCYGINSALKAIIARPRPWQADSNVINFTNSSGSSMPSGHSSSIAVVGTSLLIEGHTNKKTPKWLKITGFVVVPIICLVVAFSRLYLGQHYLTDVIAGLALGVAVAFGARLLFKYVGNKEDNFALYLLPIFFAGLFLYPSQMFTSNLSHAKIYEYIGLITSVIIGYTIEKRYIKFDIKANALFNIFKIVFGLVSTFAIFKLFDFILPNILILKFLTCFITGLYFSCGIMWFFKFFSKIMLIEYIPRQEKNDGNNIKK